MLRRLVARNLSPLGLAEAQRRALPEGKLRIVAHNGAALVGGAEHALIALLHGLQRRGHEVSLACNHEVVVDAAVRRLVPALLSPLRGDLVFGDALQFARFLRRERPNALILGTFKKIWLGGIAAAREKVPRTVARVGLASDTPRRWKYRFALQKWIDCVVLNAESMRTDFLADQPGLEAGRVVTIHTGVSTLPRKKEPGALRRELAIPPGAQVIGTVARLARQKRLERLLEAAAGLPGVHCIIAGAGSEESKLRERSAAPDLKGRVHMLGERADVGDVLAALDVFVLTSDQEGMSNAMLEALAAGLPVVSTPVSGAREALAPVAAGAPGVVVDSFEASAIRAALQQLLSNSSVLPQMAVAARASAQERFAFERMLDEWEAVLRGGVLELRTLQGHGAS